MLEQSFIYESWVWSSCIAKGGINLSAYLLHEVKGHTFCMGNYLQEALDEVTPLDENAET